MVFVLLDPVGIAVTAGIILAVAVPMIGVLTEEKRENTMNLIKHGFYSSAALAAILILVSVFMVPVFLSFVGGAEAFGILRFPILWVHALAGIVAVALGVVMVVAWLTQPLADLGCSRTWKLMLPTIMVWAIALILGVLVHVFGVR